MSSEQFKELKCNLQKLQNWSCSLIFEGEDLCKCLNPRLQSHVKVCAIGSPDVVESASNESLSQTTTTSSEENGQPLQIQTKHVRPAGILEMFPTGCHCRFPEKHKGNSVETRKELSSHIQRAATMCGHPMEIRSSIIKTNKKCK